MPERDRAERLQQLLVELAVHGLHHGEGLGMGELQAVGALFDQRGAAYVSSGDSLPLLKAFGILNDIQLPLRRSLR